MESPGSQPSTQTPPSPEPPSMEVVEQYKILMENAARTSGRRQTSYDVYVSLNVVFLGAMGFILAPTRLNSWRTAIIIGANALAVQPINIGWLLVIRRYRYIQNVHYECMQDLERRFQFASTLNIKLADAPSPTAAEVALARYFIVIELLTAGVVTLLTYLVLSQQISLLQ